MHDGPVEAGGNVTRQSEATPLEEPLNGTTRPVPLSLLVGRFRACSILGEGGQGVVYRGEHVDLGYAVAIKVLHGESASEITRARFRREARLGAQVQHPNVVRVIELGELDDGSPYLVMEHVEGVSLSDLIADRMLPAAATVELGVQLLAALAALHARDIVHRDIKPENVMIELGVDGSVTAKILDFGISKTTDKELEPATLTRAGTIVGTPSYMSPEHVLGEQLDVRSDLYAVAGVLYEALSGHPPHEAPTASAVFAKIATEQVKPLREHAPSCPPALADVIDRGLCRDRDERWPHPLAMAEALRGAAHELGLARGPDAWADVLDTRGASRLTGKRRESLTNAATATAASSPSIGGARPLGARAIVGASLLVAVGLGLLTGRLLFEPDEPSVAAPKRPSSAAASAPPVEQELLLPQVVEIEEPLPDARLDALERDARVAFVRGDGPASAALYRRVLERAPERASAWRGLGLVSLEYGEHREARVALARYLSLTPDATDRPRIERELRALTIQR